MKQEPKLSRSVNLENINKGSEKSGKSTNKFLVFKWNLNNKVIRYILFVY